MHNLQEKNTPLSNENAIYFDENIDISVCYLGSTPSSFNFFLFIRICFCKHPHKLSISRCYFSSAPITATLLGGESYLSFEVKNGASKLAPGWFNLNG